MKRLISALAVILMMGALPGVAQEVEMGLTDAERSELVTLLEDSRQQFEEVTALSTGDAWSRAPAEGKWSVGEVAEHLVIAEAGILGMAQGALEGEMDPDWKATTAMTVEALVSNLADRSQKFQAPEGFQPKGEKSRSELLEAFGKLRARTLDFVRTTDAPLKAHTAEGPPGKMNAHQWIGLIGAHTFRHNAQMVEAQAMLAE